MLPIQITTSSRVRVTRANRAPTALAGWYVLSARTARQKTIQAIELDTAKQVVYAARENARAA